MSTLTRTRGVFGGALLIGVAVALPAVSQERPTSSVGRELVFERNEGQGPSGYGFIARAAGYAIAFGRGGEVVTSVTSPPPPRDRFADVTTERPSARRARATRTSVMTMRFRGASPDARPVGEDERSSVSHYLGGDGPAAQTVPHYGRISYQDLYPGVSAVFYGTGQDVEYDVMVAPGADLNAVRLVFEGARSIEVASDGTLVVEDLAGFEVRHKRPVVHQMEGAHRQDLEAHYSKISDFEVGFIVEGYDRERQLVIDPVIRYSTYLGGANTNVYYGQWDQAEAIAVDADGNAYVTGFTNALDFPLVSPAFPGVPRYGSAFLAKFDAMGQLVFSTYFPSGSYGTGIALDPEGNIYLIGLYDSTMTSLPIVGGFQGSYFGGQIGFMAKLRPTGDQILYSTYLGGSITVWGTGGWEIEDHPFDLAVDRQGNVCVVGMTDTVDFPTRNAFHPTNRGVYTGFITKINTLASGGDSLVYSSYLGGTGYTQAYGVGVDSAGTCYVTGHTTSAGLATPSPISDTGNAFIAQVDAVGALHYFSYLVGEQGSDLAIRDDKDVIVVGQFGGNGGARLITFAGLGSASLESAVSTPFPPGTSTRANAVAVGEGGYIFIVGDTKAGNPIADETVTAANYSGAYNHGGRDVYIWSGGDESGQYLGYIGGDADDQGYAVAAGPCGEAYVAGWTTSRAGFPIVNAVQPIFNGTSQARDAFVTLVEAPASRRSASACVVPTVQVLSSTTRWKPRRSDEAITVYFSAPDDLDVSSDDAGTLEIAGPAGPIRVTAKITAAPIVPRTYSMQWKGPWKYTDPSDGQERRLPAANYPIRVKAKRNDGSEVDWSAWYEKVSLVEVRSIEFVECGSIEAGGIRYFCNADAAALADNASATGDAMPGEGRAVFPDALLPGGSYQAGLHVVARLEPDMGSDAHLVPVNFAWLDVDDPSGIDTPVSGPDLPIDNVRETARLYPTQARADNQLTIRSHGQVEQIPSAAFVEFGTSTAQGNNYRIVASTDATWLSGFFAGGEAPAGVAHTSNEPVVETESGLTQVSELLTVWRTLHVELDRIDATLAQQSSLDIEGRWTKVGSKKLEDSSRSFFDLWHPTKDYWAGAIVNPYAAGEDGACRESYTVRCPFRAKSSKEHEVKTDTGGVDDIAHAGAMPDDPERAYYLREDDLRQYGEREHDLSMLREILEGAYIKVVGHPEPDNASDTLNENQLIPWSSTIAGALDERSIFSAGRDMRNSEAFWAVQLILGLEALRPSLTLVAERSPENRAGSTNDPTLELSSGTFGLTVPTPPVPLRDLGDSLWLQYRDQPVSVSFTETIRDTCATHGEDRIRPTTPVETIYVTNQTHEVLHALTLGHDGGILCATRTNYGDPSGLDVTRRQLGKLRGLTRPDALTDPDVSCSDSGPDQVNCCPSR